MRTITLMEKLQILRHPIYDLRNTDLQQLKSLGVIAKLVNSKNADVKIPMSSKDILRLIFNINKQLIDTGNDKCFLIDYDTVCKLMLEINDFQENVIDAAWKKLIAKVEAADTVDMTTEQRLDVLKSKIVMLEEEIYSLKIQKTVILPTDNMYRTKREYDSLREQVNLATAKRLKLINKLSDAERLISELQTRILVLERKSKA